ncbi:hypothetical protein ACWV26_06525 [Rummeliibacillus sp. JY-2-4R]
MNVTNQIKFIVDQIVIAYCQYHNLGPTKERDERFESYLAQLMQITGLDREGALKYAVDFLAAQNKCEGVA